MLKRKNGFMLIISSPSGCGKTTITRSLLNDKELNLYNSISATTRLPRVGEKNEVDYFFLTEDDFKKKINDGYFLEWAEVFGRYYGTPKYVVQERLQNGVDVVFDIDWQGANQLKAQSKIDTITIFILPPSIEEL